jgi:hypothetical protein
VATRIASDAVVVAIIGGSSTGDRRERTFESVTLGWSLPSAFVVQGQLKIEALAMHPGSHAPDA